MNLVVALGDWLWRRKRYCYCCRSHHDKLRMHRHPRIAGEWICGFCWCLNKGHF